MRADPRLADLWVEGEIGRVTVSSAGHAYFALKDERNQVGCVWFRDDRLRSPFEAQAGLRVVAHGRIDLFEPQGALQLYVDSIQPAGLGDLTLRFEALKARLAAEGLFDAARKRPLPGRPATIAVVTSPSGAVWKDICHVLGRRWPLTRVVLVAAQVQGEGAPASLVTALRRVERYVAEQTAAGRPELAPAVTILARGGGSLEDLWAFNDEAVVRAVVAHTVPLVCGVGHEADVTLADFAADVRAPTPSAAAEIVVPDRLEALAGARALGRRLDGAATARVGAVAPGGGGRASRPRSAGSGRAAREQPGTGRAPARSGDAGRRRPAGRRTPDHGPAGPRLGTILPGRLARDRAQLARFERMDPLIARRVSGARASLEAPSPRWASSARRRPSNADTRSCDARPTTRSCATRPMLPAGTRLAIRVARGELPASADPR